MEQKVKVQEAVIEQLMLIDHKMNFGGCIPFNVYGGYGPVKEGKMNIKLSLIHDLYKH